jgi:predicted nucleic acid-binding protein
VIVVDTNVIAYLYLPGDFTAASEALLEQDPDWAAPVLWRSEFRNVLSGYMRRGLMSAEQAMRVQRKADSLMAGAEFEVDSDTVWRLVEGCDCPAYDCEFVALGIANRVPLITMDAKLLNAFPEHARALG